MNPNPNFGWHTSLTDYVPHRVIGIVVAASFPDPQLIRDKLIEGLERAHPNTVWVMREAPREKHAAKVAWNLLQEFGIEPILAPLTPFWKYRDGVSYQPDRGHQRLKLGWEFHDKRAEWRDSEMRATCERIVVFHDAKSGVTSEWLNYAEKRKAHPSDGQHCLAKVFVVERGKKIRKYKKGKATS